MVKRGLASRIALAKKWILSNVASVRETTAAVLTTYMNISKADRIVLQDAAQRNVRVRSFLSDVDRTVILMNEFDNKFKPL